MTFADHAELKRITEQAKADDYRLASFVEALIMNDLFQRR
jgi:hypothetical protein